MYFTLVFICCCLFFCKDTLFFLISWKKVFLVAQTVRVLGGTAIFFLSAREKDVILHPKTASALSLASQGARGKSGQHRVTILPNGKGRASKGARHSKCHRKQTAGLGRQGWKREVRAHDMYRDVHDGKPYGLKNQIYRQLRVDSPVVGG